MWVQAGVESHHWEHEPCVPARVGCRYGLVWSHTAGREHGCLNVLYILASVAASVVCIEFWEVNICTVWRSFGDCRVLKVSLGMV